MTNRLALVVAIVLGVLSILGIRFYVEKIKTQYDTAAQLVDLPVAARDLHNGEIVTDKDIQTKKFPRAILDGLGKYYNSGDVSVIQGSKVVVPEIKQGQVFEQYHFHHAVSRTALRIGEGFRAVTIPLNNVNGISGMLKPTDVVDVIATSEFKVLGGPLGTAGKGLRVTRTLLKKVQILALDDRTDPESQFTDYSTGTLQLTPDDANRLLSALDTGSIIHVVKVEAKEEEPGGTNPMWDNKAYREVEPEILKTEEQWRNRGR